MQFKKIAFFVISTTILFTGCDSKKEEPQEIKKEIVKKKQTKFTLTTTDSTNIILEKTKEGVLFKSLEGKIVLLNFWATWCLPCKAEIPHLNNLRDKFKDKFEVVAVAMDQLDGSLESSEKLNSFINDNKITYPVTNTKENYKIADLMGGVKSIPTMFMFDPSGKVVQKYVGVVPEEMIELDINRALGK